MKIKLLIVVFLVSLQTELYSSELINFPSEDGISISAELYMNNSEEAPIIVLFHQANWSRGEYLEIAPILNTMGYNCLAVDLRSGGSVNGIENLTKKKATQAMKPTQYIDALSDMRAAIKYAKEYLTTTKVIVWGSSYSAALALNLAGSMEEIDAVLSFSPGEYFTSQGKPKNFIATAASNIKAPVFITSAKSEKESWWNIYEALENENKTYYLPESSGNHGSRALWSSFSDSSGYWKAVKSFLDTL